MQTHLDPVQPRSCLSLVMRNVEESSAGCRYEEAEEEAFVSMCASMEIHFAVMWSAVPSLKSMLCVVTSGLN